MAALSAFSLPSIPVCALTHTFCPLEAAERSPSLILLSMCDLHREPLARETVVPRAILESAQIVMFPVSVWFSSAMAMVRSSASVS